MSVLDFSAVVQAWPLFLEGLWLTCVLTAVSCLLGTLLGAACAWGRIQGPPWMRAVLACYVELFRNTPFIIQIFFIFFGVASVGFKMSAIPASLIALVLNLGAYSTEIIRAGVESVPKGHIEAASALAMSRFQIFRCVILRQALLKMWPALSSQIVIVMLGSSVCSQISAEELTFGAGFITSRNFRSFEVYSVVTIMYFLLAVGVRRALDLFGRYVLARRAT